MPLSKALALALGLAAVSAASPAIAQGTPEDKAAAEALYDDAKKLYLDKNYAEACPRFERSQRLDPGIGTLLYLADCYELLGRTASAWSTFREAAAVAKAAADPRESVARGRAALLDPLLFRLAIKVEAPDTLGLGIRRNGADLRREVWGEAVPVDPGEVIIEAQAPGKAPWSTKIQVPQGAGTQTVVVPALAALAPAQPTVFVPPPTVPVADSGAGRRVAGLVTGSVGIAAVGVGAVLGGLAIAKNNEVVQKCPSPAAPCDKAVVDTSHQAGTFADVSTALFVAGGAALAAGVIVYVTAPSKPVRAWVSPWVGAGTAGVIAGRSF